MEMKSFNPSLIPQYNYDIIEKYVNGKMGNIFYIVYSQLNQFIKEGTSIIEDINQRLTLLDTLPFVKINRQILEGDLRDSAKSAKSGLSAYNRAFGTVDTYLGILASNFQLPQFLSANGVPANQIGAFQEELKIYWASTYGLQLDKLKKIRNILDELRITLAKEIELIKTTENSNFLEGIQRNSEVRILFQRERTLFWQLAEESKIPPEQVTNLEAMINTQISKVKINLAQFTKLAVKSTIENYKVMKEEVFTSQTNLQKSVIVLTFLAGALIFLYRTPAELRKKAIGKVFFSAISWVTKKNILDKAKDLCSASLEQMNDVTGKLLESSI